MDIQKRSSSQVNESVKTQCEKITEALSAYAHISVHMHDGKTITYGGKEYTKSSLRTLMSAIKKAVADLPSQIRDLNKSIRKGKMGEAEVRQAVAQYVAQVLQDISTYIGPQIASAMAGAVQAKFESKAVKYISSGRGPKDVQALTYLSDPLVNWLRASLASNQNVSAAVNNLVFAKHVSAPSLTMLLTSLVNKNNGLQIEGSKVGDVKRASRISTNFQPTQTYFGGNTTTRYVYNGSEFAPETLNASLGQLGLKDSETRSLQKKLSGQNASGLQRLSTESEITTKRAKPSRKGKVAEAAVKEPAITNVGYLNTAGMILTGYYTIPRTLLPLLGIQDSPDSAENKANVRALQEYVSWVNDSSKYVKSTKSPRSPRSPRL